MLVLSLPKVFSSIAFLSCLIATASSLPHKTRNAQDTKTALRILPLGDSITWGWQPEYRINGTNGYRAQLLADLNNAGYKNVDFVGTQRSGNMSDPDNEGHSGYTITQIHDVMAGGLAFKPNVVLLHGGTNDLLRPETEQETWADAPKRLGSIIDDVLKAVPDAVVVVAKIIQAADATANANIKVFNEAVPQVVKERVQNGFKITVVDQSIIGGTELIDGVHPTDSGYAHMGRIWSPSIEDADQQGLISVPA